MPAPPEPSLAPPGGASLVPVLGKEVRAPDGADLGQLVDILMDERGHPRAGIIDFGGFLGVGSRKIAIDWYFLQIDPKSAEAPVVLDADEKAIRAAPEYVPPPAPKPAASKPEPEAPKASPPSASAPVPTSPPPQSAATAGKPDGKSESKSAVKTEGKTGAKRKLEKSKREKTANPPGAVQEAPAPKPTAPEPPASVPPSSGSTPDGSDTGGSGPAMPFPDPAPPAAEDNRPKPAGEPLAALVPPPLSAAAPPPGEGGKAGAERAIARGLDLLNLFVADLQTGFGPYISAYLTSQGWTQTGVGLALSLGTLTAMASQVPAGAVVDRVASKRQVLSFSILAFTASALMFAIDPIPLFVYGAEILHGFSSCTYGPAVAAISLAIAGPGALGQRLGRNARFASIGNGLGAVLLSLVGYRISQRAVFFLTALLTLPALYSVRLLAPADRLTRRQARTAATSPFWKGLYALLRIRAFMVFIAGAALFTLANAAMFPLVASETTRALGSEGSLMIGAGIVLPQALVALISPLVGELTESWGRKPVLAIGFAVLPVKGLLFAVTSDPVAFVAVQLLDGIAAASFGILVPLVTSDVARNTGHFNLALGLAGFAIGVGATLSTTITGWISDSWGNPAAFLALSGIGLAALVLVLAALPETKPHESAASAAS